MSGKLVCKVRPKSNYKNLPFELRLVLEKKWSFPAIVGFSDINYLQGLNDAGVKGAEELIELIHQFEELELNLEY